MKYPKNTKKRNVCINLPILSSSCLSFSLFSSESYITKINYRTHTMFLHFSCMFNVNSWTLNIVILSHIFKYQTALKNQSEKSLHFYSILFYGNWFFFNNNKIHQPILSFSCLCLLSFSLVSTESSSEASLFCLSCS